MSPTINVFRCHLSVVFLIQVVKLQIQNSTNKTTLYTFLFSASSTYSFFSVTYNCFGNLKIILLTSAFTSICFSQGNLYQTCVGNGHEWKSKGWTYELGASSLAWVGSVGPISCRQPSTAPSLDSTMNIVGPLHNSQQKVIILGTERVRIMCLGFQLTRKPSSDKLKSRKPSSDKLKSRKPSSDKLKYRH